MQSGLDEVLVDWSIDASARSMVAPIASTYTLGT
jgi:hypothetical protein